MATRTSRAKAASVEPEPQPDQAPVAEETPNAEEQVAAAQNSESMGSEPTEPAPAAPIDFMALLQTAEIETKNAPKAIERKHIDVPAEWVEKVQEAFSKRLRVKIPGITTKEAYMAVGDLIRAAADRIGKSATVRASYDVPKGKPDTKENRVLTGLTFTVGARREGPKRKNASGTNGTSDGATDASMDANAEPTDESTASDMDADASPSHE